MKKVKQTLSKPLEKLAIEFLDRDAENTSSLDDYTAEDVMNACIIFNSVTSNYGIKRGIIDSVKKGEEAGKTLHEFVLKRTGVNTKTYYNKLK